MKRIFALIAALALALTMTGCKEAVKAVEVDTSEEESMFVVVEKSMSYRVLYDKDTKVMYVMSASSRNYGTFTLLVNPDGTPKLWEG